MLVVFVTVVMGVEVIGVVYEHSPWWLGWGVWGGLGCENSAHVGRGRGKNSAVAVT